MVIATARKRTCLAHLVMSLCLFIGYSVDRVEHTIFPKMMIIGDCDDMLFIVQPTERV